MSKMKQLIKPISGSNPFSTFLILIFILIQLGCPDPPDTTDCGTHQVKVNGECECEEGYHWNENQTKCLMDTTSHNFVWEIDTLGISGSLRDVQIINENNIWVVGNIETDSTYYGAAIWDGESWELKKLKGPGISVQTITPRGLWYFSEDNIWFASGSIYHWDGIETSLVWLRDINTDETVEKIWASSENDIYFAGKEGTIIHYNGTSFTKMNSGTDIWLKSVTGFKDPETDIVYMWAGGWEDIRRGQVIYYNGNEWIKIWDEYNPFYEDHNYLDPGAIWVADSEDLILYVGGSVDGIVVHHKQNDFSEYQILHNESNGAFHDINGNSTNDHFFVGDFGNVLHFNGSSFKRYPELADATLYSAVDQAGDQVIICRAYTPIIVRGFRQ